MGAIAAAILVAAWFGFGVTERYFLVRAAEQNGSTLRLAAAGLRGALMRYEPLPGLIADKIDIRRIFTGPADDARIDRVNRQLQHVASDVGASDIYVMNISGLTLAASNFDQEPSFIGRSFNYRPYFQEALSGQLGRNFALGTTSLKRGYYFAAPVRDSGDIIGVVAVKVSVDELESDWRNTGNELIVSDRNGVIFMSSRGDWLFKSLAPLTPETLQAISDSRQYPLAELAPLDATFELLAGKDASLVSVSAPGEPRTRGPIGVCSISRNASQTAWRF